MNAQTTGKALRAATYGRKSTTDKANPGKSVADQLREAQAEVETRGFTLDPAHIFADDGVSASRFGKGKKRPGFAGLVTALEAREVDVVVMAEQSRSARRMSVIGTLVELCADNGQTLVIGGRAADPRNPADLVMIGVQAGIDAGESERTSERSRRGARSTARAGKPAGKHLYGYSRTYDPLTRELLEVVEVPEEAAIVREIARRVLAGDSMRQIAIDLNKREVPTPSDAIAVRQGREPKGRQWSGSQLTRMVLLDAYAGQRIHKGALTPAVWPALITPGEHERLVAIVRDPARRKNGGGRPGSLVHWLSGVAKCGECGSSMRSLVNRGTYRHYACQKPGCMKVSRAANALEDYVAEYVFAIVENPDAIAAIAGSSDDTPVREALVRLDELGARRANIRSQMAAGSLLPEDGSAVLALIVQEIESTEKALRSMTLPRNVADVVTPDMRSKWESFSPARKRAVTGALVDVRVLSMHGRKTRHFLPEFVSVTPKGAAS